jgi:bifunctional DNA-binding transcriptional regulator/antitoxin component of YhaV-PrlF toxin-antitoxin module
LEAQLPLTPTARAANLRQFFRFPYCTGYYTVASMQTKVSPKGRVALPVTLCHCLGIRAGDRLEATIEAGRIVLTPRKVYVRRPKIAGDSVRAGTLSRYGARSSVVTRKEIEEILAYLPSNAGTFSSLV